PTRFAHSLVPHVGPEDVLLARLVGPYLVDSRPPAGWIARVDLASGDWTLVACGLRNPYDIAINRQGELFVYDADMEYDIGTPWYRPTRICHVTSGADFGWRSGSGKLPPYAAETLPPAAEMGPGSPTGLVFAY